MGWTDVAKRARAELGKRVQAELVKALSPAVVAAAHTQPGAVDYTTLTAVRADVHARGVRQPYDLDWEEPPVGFGPGTPIGPVPFDPRLPTTNRSLPRRSEYPVAWNLPGNGMPAVPWVALRRFADQVDVVRLCISIRKHELTAVDWAITVRHDVVQAIANAQQTATSRVQAQAAQQYATEIERITRFWERPDNINRLTFGEWLSALIEEVMVLDALSIYPHPNLSGELHSLELLDGSTIKPLLDNRGAYPQPPQPAYQQILWGFPRGEFTLSEDQDDGIGTFTSDELIYRPRDRRTFTPYGFSPVEQALIAGDLYLKRQEWLRAEYSEGAIPAALMIPPEALNWTPTQVREYEQAINAELSGQTKDRHRWRVTPPGVSIETPANFAERYNQNFDEYLVKLLMSFFDVMPTEIGFTQHGGLGGSGHQQGEADTLNRRGNKPFLEWIADIFNEINYQYLGAPRELTFRFDLGEADDEKTKADVVKSDVSVGKRTLNDVRADDGLPPYDFEEADEPFIVTPQGPVFLRGLKDHTDTMNAFAQTGAEAGIAATNARAANGGVDPGTDPNAPGTVKLKPPPSTDGGKQGDGPKGQPDQTVNEAKADKKSAGADTVDPGVNGLPANRVGRQLHRTKEQAQYRSAVRDSTNAGDSSCKVCAMNTNGRCDLLQQQVEDDAVCDYFLAQHPDPAAEKVIDARYIADQGDIPGTNDKPGGWPRFDETREKVAAADTTKDIGSLGKPAPADDPRSIAHLLTGASNNLVDCLRHILASTATADDPSAVEWNNDHSLAHGMEARDHIARLATWFDKHPDVAAEFEAMAAADPIAEGVAANKAAELGAYIRYASKRAGRTWRDFTFNTIDAPTADDLNELGRQGSAALLKSVLADMTKAGRRPKVRDGKGLASHRALVAHYAPRIARALAASIDVDAVVQHAYDANIGKAAGDDPILPYDATDLDDAISDLLSTAWDAGHQQALGLLGRNPNWEVWQPGDSAAAKQASGLRTLLDNRGVTIKSILDTKMDQLSGALSDAIAQGNSIPETTRLIRDLLADPTRAEMIANTETNRAMTASTMATYAANGVQKVDWLLSFEPCELCQENADAAPVDLGDEWPNGDPPVHPNCECSLAPAAIDDTTTSPDEGDGSGEE